MSSKSWIVMYGFFGIAVGLVAVADSGAQPGGMMQKKEMMMKMMGKGGGMGMMDCCGMMGGGKKKETDDVQKMTMECCKKDKGELCDMLKSDKAEERFSAAFAIGEKKLPLTTELIGMLTDKSDPVRQAARRSLILTSYHLDAMRKENKKGAVAGYIDYGPLPNVNEANVKISVKNWTAWAKANDKDLKKLQQRMEPTSTISETSKHSKDALETVNANLKSKKAILIDVREKTEWDAGHLTQARLLPLSQLTEGVSASELSKILAKDQTIYLHCGSGKRVLPAAEILRKAGYTIQPLASGYEDLVKAGFEKASK
jgi:rhodanese-related sulfurtransferase